MVSDFGQLLFFPLWKSTADSHLLSVLYLIMKSEWFRDALADLPPSSSKITLTATPRNQPLPEDQPAATASSLSLIHI